MKFLLIVLFLFKIFFSFTYSIDSNLKFKENLPIFKEYVYIKNLQGIIREQPSVKSEPLEKYPINTKLKLIKTIKARKGDIWHEVKTLNGKKGYISNRVVNIRTFEFQKMFEKIYEIETFLTKENSDNKTIYSINSYIPNPNNVNLKRSKDKYGTSLDQNALAKFKNESIFIPDGSIVSLYNLENTTAQVKSPFIKEFPLSIDKKYLKSITSDNLNLKKIIVIDTFNQNFGVFEKINNSWNLISYAYSKTGLETHIGFETPKGFFLLQNLKNIMTYNDENGKKLGFAKYALRFSGGGYIHGTPIDYESKNSFSIDKENELGTISGTRKCVRTITRHSKFLFDWIKKKPINYNDYIPLENVIIVSI